MNIEITSNTLKKPWCARISGVETFTKDGERRMRFVRSFGFGCIVTPTGKHTYKVSINHDGIYELRVPGKLSEFYAYVGGKTRKLVDPFPDNWAEYMRDNGVDYEGVWCDIWACLKRQYDKFGGILPKPELPKLTLQDLEEMDIW